MIDPRWFVGEGWPAVLVASTFIAAALLTLPWLRGPGSRPHDPPIAHDMVRSFAGILALFGGVWLVRALAGIGGFLAVAAVMLIVSLVRMGRARARRSQ